MVKEEKEPQFRLSDEPVASEIKAGVLVATDKKPQWGGKEQ